MIAHDNCVLIGSAERFLNKYLCSAEGWSAAGGEEENSGWGEIEDERVTLSEKGEEEEEEAVTLERVDKVPGFKPGPENTL